MRKAFAILFIAFAVLVIGQGFRPFAVRCGVEVISLDPWLINVVACEQYQLTVIQLDSNDVMTNATVRWPDGRVGTFLTLSNNPTWKTVDSYSVSYPDDDGRTKTVTQAAVLRNGNGVVTNKPALTIQ